MGVVNLGNFGVSLTVDGKGDQTGGFWFGSLSGFVSARAEELVL